MTKTKSFVAVGLMVATVLLSACGAGVDGQQVANAVEQMASVQNGATANNAMATVSTRSLRVRAEPNSDSEVITGIKEGEEYQVAGLSSDGEWVQLAIPKAPGGKGWVSSNFVSVAGSITDAPITDAAPSTATSAAAGSAAATTEPTVAAIEPPAAGTATVTTEGARLRVRAQADADSDIVGYVYNGENYPVVEQNGDGSWVRIGGAAGTDNPNGGWVSAEFLVIGQ
ncbi:MAG: SH3 domain-containing protein [Anaerolineales bacterium]|nr:SH3 domain-containing protein [Anaerolineales bacterium]